MPNGDKKRDLILAHRIRREASEVPDMEIATFVHITPEGEIRDESRSYKQLWDNGRRIGAALEAAGMKKGDSFAMLMQNHPEFVDAMVGSSGAGTVFVPIDPRTKGHRLVHMLTLPDCRGAIVADYALPALREVLDQLPHLEWVWVLGEDDGSDLPGKRMLHDILAAPVPEIEIKANDVSDPMQMLFTSGTTGDPKAILSRYDRMAVAQAIPQILGLNADDVMCTGLSLTHANAQLITLGGSLYNRIRCVIIRKFTKSRLWEIIRRYGCTQFNLLGGMTTAIYAEPERPNDADNPVRMVLSAGMPKEIWEKFAKRFGLGIFEFYGAAEGGLTFNPPGAGPIGSVGKPPPDQELAILDEEGNRLPPGTPGEIAFRSVDGSAPAVTYFGNPEASEKKTRGGWLHMGDVGYVDEDGWLYFLYRSGGGIRRNGDFISPAAVEKVIAEIDSVDDVFVYGIATPQNAPGEKEVVAAVVPRDRATFDPAEIFAVCRRELEPNAVPRFLQVVDEIPKTASEKPQERFLAEAFESDRSNVFEEERA